MTKEQQARAAFIDSTILKPEATAADIRALCAEAKECGFATVCVNPCRVALAHEELKGSNVKVCTVVGFPLGSMTTLAKAAEARDAVQNGAAEVDMVIAIGSLKDHDLKTVTADIAAVVASAKDTHPSTLVKVIIEACLLTDEEKTLACEAAMSAHADYVKTSTGFSTGGATVHDVALMRKTVGTRLGVKAAGGIRTREDFDALVAAGASRIGTSHGKELI